jgi:hypothetical protein
MLFENENRPHKVKNSAKLYKFFSRPYNSMKKRGRPVRSDIRQNVIEILDVIGKGYGYEIHKLYNNIFPKCTRESVYYHLKKGVTLGEFSLLEVKQEKGEYSWGTIVEKRYYVLGSNALAKGEPKVHQVISDLFPKKLENNNS